MYKTKEKIYDFLVIGAGIAGLSSAYHLLLDGYSVAVVDRNNGHQNASTLSTGILSHDPDAKWPLMVSRFGVEGARKVWELSELAMKLLGAYAHEIPPYFLTARMPAHIFSNSDAKDEELFGQYEMYRKIGIQANFARKGNDLHKNFHAVLTIPEEGQTNNWAIITTLARRVRKLGGTIFLNQPIVSITPDKGHARAVTNAGRVFEGSHAIIASGDNQVLSGLPLGIRAMRTFTLGFEKHQMPALFRSSVMWDNEKPYHYIRSFRGQILWVGGGDVEEKDYDPNKDYYASIEKFARGTLIFDNSYKRISAWSGTFYPSESGLPFIGKIRNKPIFLNVGFGGTGILLSFVSGYLLASWLKGKEKRYRPLFALAK